jgi:DNA polymerase III subunit chi
MGAVYFYHMTRSPLSATLPTLLQKSRGAGWRVLVRAPDATARDQIDDMLWTFDPGSFLPHGVEDGQLQSILITDANATLGDREALVSVFGAPLEAEEIQTCDRGMILFDGQDADAVAHARMQWKSLTAAGVSAQYWSDADGGWTMKASTDDAG